MAKRRRRDGGESISGYFRTIFEKRPSLLDSGSNKELLEKWLSDHPGIESVPSNVKQILANLKSVLRKKVRSGKFVPANSTAPAPALAKATTVALRSLEALEEHIDDCLSLAKQQDREALAEVIKHLRVARNKVVWMMG
jgi:hypothetical protein